MWTDGKVTGVKGVDNERQGFDYPATRNDKTQLLKGIVFNEYLSDIS
jgi:hypothetical protein